MPSTYFAQFKDDEKRGIQRNIVKMRKIVTLSWIFFLLEGLFFSSLFAEEGAVSVSEWEIPSETLAEMPANNKENAHSFFGVDWRGYVNAGYFTNTRGAEKNGNVNANSWAQGAFNAAYVRAAKEAANNGRGFDWGFDVDFMFGEDARITRVERGLDEDWVTGHDADGNATYGFALPQLYADFALNNWGLRAGHFYSLLGYEGVPATDRFFYSSGLAYDALPTSHTGVLVSYNGWEKAAVRAGWVNGINQGFSAESGGNLLLGDVAIPLGEQFSFRYALAAGDFFNDIVHTQGSMHSITLEASPSEPLKLATTVDWQYLKTDSIDTATNVVLGQHAYFTFNDRWKAGARIEWERTETDFFGRDLST